MISRVRSKELLHQLLNKVNEEWKEVRMLISLCITRIIRGTQSIFIKLVNQELNDYWGKEKWKLPKSQRDYRAHQITIKNVNRW